MKTKILNLEHFYKERYGHVYEAPDNNPYLEMSKNYKLPKEIIVLDIEIAGKPNFKQMADTPIALVGVHKYILKKKSYILVENIIFSDNEFVKARKIKELESYLHSSKAIILGYNVFDYDFKILGSKINLHGIIERTVDLLTLIYIRNSYRTKYLSLDNLSKNSTGPAKVKYSNTIATLWKKGKYSDVIKYNYRDLEMTFHLWIKLHKKGVLHTSDEQNRQQPIQLIFGDLKYLYGEQKMITYDQWIELTHKKNRIFQKTHPIGLYAEHFTCNKCKIKHHKFMHNIILQKLRSQLVSFQEGSEVKCLKCKEVIGLSSSKKGRITKSKNAKEYVNLVKKMLKTVKKNDISYGNYIGVLDSQGKIDGVSSKKLYSKLNQKEIKDLSSHCTIEIPEDGNFTVSL